MSGQDAAGPMLVTGGSGQLAVALEQAAGRRHRAVRRVGRPEFDFDRPETVAAIFAQVRPSLVVNAAAWTAVDLAEANEAAAARANAQGPGLLAQLCASAGVPMIHVSTDYVFDGEKGAPYVETDPTSPTGVYGATKLAGEQAVLEYCDRALVARVSWLFSAFGQNFLQMMLKLADTQPLLKVVDDQRARPTASGDVAGFMLSQAPRLSRLAAGAPEWGLLHLVNDGVATRFEMAQAIFELARPGQPLPAMQPAPTSAFPTPARRALNCELDTVKLQGVFGLTLRPWREALEDTIEDLNAASVTA